MGLISWYKMDGDATDSSGYDYDGTLSGTTTVDGKIGQALDFNGTTDYIYLSSPSHLALPQMTVAFWINADSYSNYRGIFYLTNTLSEYLILRQESSVIRVLIEEANIGVVSATTPSLVSYVDTWVHLAFTQDGTGWRFYINGVESTLTGTNSGYCSDHITIGNMWIGRSSWVESYIDGTLDDFRIYDNALSTYEIKQLAMAKICHVSFDSDGTYTDKTEYQNHPTVTGTPTWTEDTNRGFGAVTLTGSEYLTIANELDGQANLEQEWSIMAWVNLDNTGGGQQLSSFNTAVDIVHTTTDKLLLYLNSGGDDYYHYSNATGLVAGQGWKHVAFCFRNSDLTRQIYVDGVDVTNGGPDSGIPLGMNANENFFLNCQGEVTDLQIFARLLSQTEVQEIYNQRAALDSGGNLWV